MFGEEGDEFGVGLAVDGRRLEMSGVGTVVGPFETAGAGAGLYADLDDHGVRTDGEKGVLDREHHPMEVLEVLCAETLVKAGGEVVWFEDGPYEGLGALAATGCREVGHESFADSLTAGGLAYIEVDEAVA